VVCIGRYSIRAPILRLYVMVVSGTAPMCSNTRARGLLRGQLEGYDTKDYHRLFEWKENQSCRPRIAAQ